MSTNEDDKECVELAQRKSLSTVWIAHCCPGARLRDSAPLALFPHTSLQGYRPLTRPPDIILRP
jgi:hypothetical protein